VLITNDTSFPIAAIFSIERLGGQSIKSGTLIEPGGSKRIPFPSFFNIGGRNCYPVDNTKIIYKEPCDNALCVTKEYLFNLENGKARVTFCDPSKIPDDCIACSLASDDWGQ
jgi:hypothetical protein